ncbi:MAG: aminodeoxychorismate/anthranilate synthase component II [Bacteroidetes bacterium 4484_276]|nr:MAG: aminodeoxychorismate/anthranilate synthase component II [Bacteroidetes bacterium 4484_276]
MKVLLVDNYDSFTFNLVNILRKNKQVGHDVVRIDKINLDELNRYDKILFSPGPDVPHIGDVMWQIINRYKSEKSILGVCLGMQAISMYFGAKLLNLKKVYHGRIKNIEIINGGDVLYKDIDSPFVGGLYHSWIVDEAGFPDELQITSKSMDGMIMSVRHKNFDICGVQFHPESVMTPQGEGMVKNWLLE